MIEYKDPFGQDTIITVLPVHFNKTIQFAVNSKYKYIAVWDLNAARQIYKALETAILQAESK